MKELGDFHIREHLLQNYEGWRVLDDPQYDNKFDFWVMDTFGFCRHIDPIIDDPRLTHKQRVCRLYKWASLELKQWQTFHNSWKNNIGQKVIRNKFEKYRYVTDPAACDMMIRESQKYLRDQCYWWFYKRNSLDKQGPQCTTLGMSHPENSLVYDHWVSNDVFYYDDAKIHRFSSHHPMYSGAGEMSDRYGDNETLSPYIRKQAFFLAIALLVFIFLNNIGILQKIIFRRETEDPYFLEYNKQFDPETQAAVAAAERNRRMRNDASFLSFDWNRVIGSAPMTYGHMTETGNFIPDKVA